VKRGARREPLERSQPLFSFETEARNHNAMCACRTIWTHGTKPTASLSDNGPEGNVMKMGAPWEFRVSAGVSQCGGFRANVCHYWAFEQAERGRGEFWSRHDWRRERNWQLTLSEFVGRQLPLSLQQVSGAGKTRAHSAAP
jgi:hypothetical protein